MITYLRGEVAAVYEGRVVLDVNGVGYQIFVSARDAADMPRTGPSSRSASIKITSPSNSSCDALSDKRQVRRTWRTGRSESAMLLSEAVADFSGRWFEK